MASISVENMIGALKYRQNFCLLRVSPFVVEVGQREHGKPNMTTTC